MLADWSTMSTHMHTEKQLAMGWSLWTYKDDITPLKTHTIIPRTVSLSQLKLGCLIIHGCDCERLSLPGLKCRLTWFHPDLVVLIHICFNCRQKWQSNTFYLKWLQDEPWCPALKVSNTFLNLQSVARGGGTRWELCDKDIKLTRNGSHGPGDVPFLTPTDPGFLQLSYKLTTLEETS